MNKKLIWLIIIAVVITGAVYYIYSSIKPFDCCHGEQYLNQTTPTSDWKIYTRNNMYEFSYPTYGKIEETNSVVTDTTVVLTSDWMNTFDVTTHPEEDFCKSNPYSSAKNSIKEGTVTKYGNEYRLLYKEDSSSPTKIITEERYYKFKGDTCYMIVLRISDKAGSQIAIDIEKIFSTFKFTN